MGFSTCRIWLAALSCLLFMGGEVQCDCPNPGPRIPGVNYTLTRELQTGSMLIYLCPEGHYPYPAISHQCQLDGTWSSDPVTNQECRAVECPDPRVMESGLVSPFQDKYYVNQVTTYECYAGYTLKGSETRTCLPNGKWSGSTPICSGGSDDDCADPGIPPGARREGNDFGIDDKVKYSCRGKDLFLVGPSERVCLENGEWTGFEPACYFKYTYDTPLEVSQKFSGAIKTTLTTLQSSNDTQVGRSIRISKSGILNIYIAVDISESIKETEYNRAKDCVLKLINKIATFSVTPNYEIIFFASEVHEAVNILDFYTGSMKLNDLTRKVENFQRLNKNTGTNLYRAFRSLEEKMSFIRQRVENQKKGSFQEHRHVILLFSDGQYNLESSPLNVVKSIRKMVYTDHTGENNPESRADYLDIYVFAMGTDIFDGDLQPLATGTGGDHYYRMSNIAEFGETLDAMINEEDVVDTCGLHRPYMRTKYDPQYAHLQRQAYPWWASLIVQRGHKPLDCLGALVSARFILTAAHCIPPDTYPADITVKIGDAEMKGVQTFYRHPDYNISAKVKDGVAEFYDYDVALVQLKEDLNSSISVRPICIPCTQETSDALRLTGAESTCQKQEETLFERKYDPLNFLTQRGPTVRLKTAYAKRLDTRDNCIKEAVGAKGITATDPKVAVTDNFLCSGGFEHNRDHISCKGDSGGAVFKTYFDRIIQVAVVSWGTEDICSAGEVVESSETSRDFHLNLFRVVPFLKKVLGNDNQNDFVPIKFLD